MATQTGFNYGAMLALLDRARRNRYLFAVVVGNLAVWLLMALAISVTPRNYVVEWSLILPSSDPDTQVNMTDIGQAHSANRSTYDSKSLDPRVNYRTVITSRSVLEKAAELAKLPLKGYGVPKIKLLDQSSIIELKTAGGSADEAVAKARALHAAFTLRLDELRADEAAARDRGIESSVRASREKLEQAQSNLVQFKVASQVVSTKQLEEAAIRINSLQVKASELTSQIARLDGQASRLTRSLGFTPAEAGRIVTLQADSEFVALLGRYATVSAELAEYNSRWDTSHPKVVSASGRQQSTLEALVRRAKALLNDSGTASGPLAGTVTLTRATTLNAMARELHPRSADERERYRTAFAAANPGLFAGNPHPGAVQLPAGTRLEVPIGLQAPGAERPLADEGFAQQLRRLSLTGSDRNQEPLFRELVTIHSQSAAARAELAAVRAEHVASRAQLDEIARDSSQLDDLERRLKFSEAVFNSALGKSDVGGSNIFSSYPLVQLLEAPRAPEGRDKRPLLMAIAGGIACSILLTIALTLAWLRKKGAAK